MASILVNRRHVLAGAAAGLALPSRSAFAQQLEPVKYLTPFGFLMGFTETMYGDTGGFFRKRGIDITIEGGKGSAMAVQQVSAGNVLISRTGGTDLIKAYAKDPSIVAVGDCYPKDLFFVISHADKPILKPEDMAGKTLGLVSVGGATENILDMMLAKAGVPAGEVRRETVGNAPAAFEFVKAGRVAAFIATGDTVAALNHDRQPVKAWSCDDVAPSPGQVYIVSKKGLDAKRDAIAKFLAAVHDTLGAMVSAGDPGTIVTSMLTKYDVFEAKRPDKGLSVLRNTIENYKLPYASKLKIDPATFASAYDLMIKAKIIQPLQDRAFYDTSAWQKAFG
ncbi:ABC transporter substrate-binding protein [Enterovirga aerilata]|uniref:Thiamine pyrimidine synthase n=1 Tax=Enterovirga aerilata TaxID=2730920 RepID=A0A849I5R5_9HYPH|nr:ABC transporter substrate-binding protein [Enterovirga sp. DB1703]NNM71440.1 ABC transporter substrate-binding protein [Enterovirga sp. DB1703]